jgi:hypothetical protein
MEYNTEFTLQTSAEIKESLKYSGDPRWATVMVIAEIGNIDGACKLAIQLIHERGSFHINDDEQFDENDFFVDLNASLEDAQFVKQLLHKTLEDYVVCDVVYSLLHLASMTNKTSPVVFELISVVTKAGLASCPFNIAMTLAHKANSPDEFKLAERYFLIAIDSNTNPEKKAGALVNYGALILDGSITGERNLSGAFDVFEKAALLGSILGMFNAAAVCSLIDSTILSTWKEREAFWWGRLIEHIEAGGVLWDSESNDLNHISKILNESRLRLAIIHIDDEIESADIMTGVSLLSRTEPVENDRELFRLYYETSFFYYLAGLEKPEINSGGNNWKHILNAIGWRAGEIETNNGLTECFWVSSAKTKDRKVLFVVIDGIYDADNIALTSELQRYLDEHAEIIVASKEGLYKQIDDSVFTPLHFVTKGGSKILSIFHGMQLHQLLQNAADNVEFLDERFASQTAIIPCALSIFTLEKNMYDAFDNDGLYCEDDHWRRPFIWV